MSIFHPKDIVAIVVVAFIFLFKYQGFDGQLDAILALIIGYYFAKRADGRDNGN